MQVKSYGALALGLFLCACSGQSPQNATGVKLGKPYTINGTTYTPRYDPSYDETGLGSWYGPGFNGKRTASGERFDQNDLTAAHPTLPMPSLVRVTNIKNNQSLVVRINDRGPFHSDRIIDLSKAAAMQIGLLSTMPVHVQYLARETEEYWTKMNLNVPQDIQFAKSAPYGASNTQAAVPVSEVQSVELGAPQTGGLISEAQAEEPQPVMLQADNAATVEAPQEVIARPLVELPPAKPQAAPKPAAAEPLAAGAHWYVQAGSFAYEENAQKLVGKLSALGHTTIRKFEVGEKTFWRVRVGPAESREAADALQTKVDALGIMGAKVVRGE